MYLCDTVLLVVTILVAHTVHVPAIMPHPPPVTEQPSALVETPVDHAPSFSNKWPDDVQLGCKELRAKRFISDGFCTSIKAIKEVVCTGHCMPIKEQNLPWWAEFTKYWAKPKFKEWRCVEAVIKLKKVQLMCENGETRTYRIKIVKSCRCKSYEREPNRTDLLKGKASVKSLKTDTVNKKRKSRRSRRRSRKQRVRKGTKHRGSSGTSDRRELRRRDRDSHVSTQQQHSSHVDYVSDSSKQRHSPPTNTSSDTA